MSRKMISLSWYPIVVFGLGVVGVGLFYFVNSSLFKEVVNVFLFVFRPTGAQLTTMEMQPLLFPNGVFTLSLVWGNFGLAIFVALASLLVLIVGMKKHGEATVSLAVVWTVVILAMTLGQRRFAYYFAVNVALLSGYLSWLFIKWVGLAYTARGMKGKKSKRQRQVSLVNSFNVALVTVVIFLVVFLPIIPNTVAVASKAPYVPSDAWCESLGWLRANSPSPFPNDMYLEKDVNEEADYSVLSWWDYGYWITRIARRVPNANPGQNPLVQAAVADFLTAQEEQVGNGVIEGLGSKYVIIDFDSVTGKFWAIASYAGEEKSDYLGVYYVANSNQMIPVQLYYPDYYRSLSVRLYNFDGKEVESQNVFVISYEQRAVDNGVIINLITNGLQFKNYDEAESYVSSQKAGNWRIVGDNPFVSPIHLEAVEHYNLVYKSSQEKQVGNTDAVPEVKIFEYVGAGQ